MMINLILSQVVHWELLFPNQGSVHEAQTLLTIQNNALVLVGGRYQPPPDERTWGFCSGIDTANGTILWDREFLGYDRSIIITLAKAEGCLYLAGQCYHSSAKDILVAKLDGSGNLLWEKTSETPDWNDAVAISAQVDPLGNLVVLGFGWVDDIDIALLSWDRNGNRRWIFAYDSPWHMDDVGFSASSDEKGNTYVVGYYTGPIKKRWLVEPLTMRCEGNAEPKPVWGPPNTCDGIIPVVIKVDSSGNLVWVDDCEYWTGGGEFMFCEYRNGELYASGFEITGNLYTQCTDEYGQHLWHAWEYDNFMTMAQQGGCVDANGNLYITGEKSNPGPEAFVVSYSAYGQRRFVKMVFPGEGLRVAVDPWGNLFVAGSVIDSLGEDFMVVKMDTLGNVKWTYRKDDGTPDPNQPDECYALLPDNRGGVFAMGVIYDSAMTPIQYLVHLADTTGGISEGSESERGLVLTPAPSGFLISGYEGEAQVYDPAGRLILTREIKSKALIGPLKPGVYFVVAGSQRAKVAVR